MKKILALITALMMVVALGFVTTGSTAFATEYEPAPCVATQGSYTEWVNDGPTIQTVTNSAPDADTLLVRYVPAGTVQVGNNDAVPATEDHYINLQWFVYTGQLDGTPTRTDSNWHGVPALPNGLPHDPSIGGIYNVSNNDNGRGSWFKYDGTFVPGTPGSAETFHTEYKWQKQVRELVPGDTCIEVTPNASGVPDDCDEDPFGTLTADAVEGVTYTLQDGSLIVGTIAANGTNTVTAHLDEGYALAEGAQLVFGPFTSDPATDCGGGSEPTTGEDVVETSSTDYQCDDAFQTVTNVVTTTPWTQEGEGPRVFGEPVVDTTTQTVKHEVVPCDTDTPDNPSNPDSPDTPKTVSHPKAPQDNPAQPKAKTVEVPTEIAAGL